MAFMNDYLKEKQKLAKEEAVSYSNSTKAKSKKTKKLSNFMEEYEEQRSALEASNDFAPVRSNISRRITVAQKDNNERTWFNDSDAVDDDFDWTDFDDWKGLAKATLATGVDVLENAGTGLLGMGEKIVDAGAYIAPYITKGHSYQIMYESGRYGDVEKEVNKNFEESKKEMAEFIPKDLYDEEAVAKAIISNPIERFTGVSAERDSVLGEKSDALAQSAGQLAGQYGLSMVGVPWFVTSFATSFGSEAENALNQGATYEQAGMSAAISAGAEVLSEKMFGGDVFTNGSGLSFSDKILTRTIANKGLRTLLKWGIDLFGEGSEEAVSDFFSNLGTSLYRDENLEKILFSEEALDGYLESYVGGMLLGGGMSAININQSKRNGEDYTSGLTKSEEAEVRKRYEESLAERDGKPNFFEKNKLFDSAIDATQNSETFYYPPEFPVRQSQKDTPSDGAYAPMPNNVESQETTEKREPLREPLKEQRDNPVVENAPTTEADDIAPPRADVRKASNRELLSLRRVIQSAESGLTPEGASTMWQEAARKYNEVKNEDPELNLGKHGWVMSQEQSAGMTSLYLESQWYKALSENPEYLTELKSALERGEIPPLPKSARDYGGGLTYTKDNPRSSTATYTPSSPHWRMMLEDAYGKGYDTREVFGVARRAAYDELVNDVESGMSAYELRKKAKELYSELKLFAELSTRDPGQNGNKALETLLNDMYRGYRDVAKNRSLVDFYKKRSASYAPPAPDIAPMPIAEKADSVAPVAETNQVVEPKAPVSQPKASPRIVETKPEIKPKKPQTPAERYADALLRYEKMFDSDTRENREKYKSAMEARDKAKDFITNGAEGVKSIDDIFNQIDIEHQDDFHDYMYHLLNIDRTTLEERFGKKNRAVFGIADSDIYLPAEESQKIVDDLEAKHPEFKNIAEDVYTFIGYLRKVKVDSGAATQETYDNYAEMYPHYVPISRSRWGKQVSTDLLKFLNNQGESASDPSIDAFVSELREASTFHKIKTSGYDLFPLKDALIDHAYRSYWDAETAKHAVAPVQTESPVSDAPIKEALSAESAQATETNTADATPVTPEPKTKSPQPTLIETPKTENKGVWKKIGEAWHTFQDLTLGHGLEFERISKKHNNRSLESDWDFIGRAPSVAQQIISNGSDAHGVRSLLSIHDEVKSAGEDQAFNDYLGHLRNMDGLSQYSRYGLSNQSFMGRESSVSKSAKAIRELEAKHPHFKTLAQDVYTYVKHQINQMAEHGLITQEEIDVWNELYPHYVPMRTSNDVNVPVLESIANFTLQTQYAISMNDFGLNLMQTIDPGVDHTFDNINITSFFNGLDAGWNMFNLEGGEKPTFTIYENGYLSKLNITPDMYVALKPVGDFFSYNIPIISDLNNLRRNSITTYSLPFGKKNFVKDIQDVLIFSQHPLETYANYPTAIGQMLSKGDWYKEYKENGGVRETYFDAKNSEFGEGKGLITKLETKTPLKYIIKANNFIETVPRLAEYIASREAGKSVKESMLDAARVTVNFNAGGKVTKFLDRNGATFLNASVQGAMQHIRTITEASHAGARGWAGLAARYLVSGLPIVLLNNLIWDDDEDYEKLPDYITNNYYIVWKYGDGKFIRVPKGRTAAVIQNAIEQVVRASSGDHDADWEEFFNIVAENLAPNNPITDNMFAPIGQVLTNKTWYGEDIVPKRMQDDPVEEQFDEKTDYGSIWLGEKLGLSPKKINYLLDQYSGVLGDTFLPMFTPKAESPIDNPLMKLFAPDRDIFTTDSVLNNRVTGDFYDTLEEAESRAGFDDATEEDILKSQFLISCNAEISELLNEQRNIQTSDLSDSEKYKQVREIKEEINELMEQALENYEDADIDGVYAEVGGRRYNYDADEERWYEITPKKKDGDDNGYYVREQNVTKAFGISYGEYWNNKEGYDDAFYIASGYDNEAGGEGSTMAIVKHVFGIENFASFAPGLASIKADYDDDGNPIKGSRREKLEAYLDGLDIPEVEKYILFKSQYDWDDSHNYEIINYLNDRDDISYYEMVDILEELGFDVDSEGNITW